MSIKQKQAKITIFTAGLNGKKKKAIQMLMKKKSSVTSLPKPYFKETLFVCLVKGGKVWFFFYVVN